KSRKEAIEAKNHLDSAIYGAEKMLTENRDKIAEADRLGIEQAIAEAKKVLEANRDAKDAGPLKEAHDTLQKALYKVGEAMYRAAAAQGQPPPGAGAGPGDTGATAGEAGAGAGSPPPPQSNVVDAEFEER